MLQLRQLDLKFAFARAGAPGENVENQRRAVKHLALEHLLEVAALCGGKFVIENDSIHLLTPTVSGELVGLAPADESSGRRCLEPLRAVTDNLGSGGHGQLRQFIQRFAHLPARARFQFRSNEENPFGSFVRCRYERFQLL